MGSSADLSLMMGSSAGCRWEKPLGAGVEWLGARVVLLLDPGVPSDSLGPSWAPVGLAPRAEEQLGTGSALLGASMEWFGVGAEQVGQLQVFWVRERAGLHKISFVLYKKFLKSKCLTECVN